MRLHECLTERPSWAGLCLQLLLFAVVIAGLFGPLDARDSKPNIVFIMADDMGYGDAGCYGQKIIQTPNIDRLASQGLRFTQVYAGASVCAPSRSVLMTGLHTGHTRVRGNFGVAGGVTGLGGGEHRIPLCTEDQTVAAILKEAGYTTGMTGKWGLGEPNTSGYPTNKGWDQFFGHVNQRRAHTYYPTFLWMNKHRFQLTGNHDGGRQQYSHDLFTSFALNFIRHHAEEPFFLYVPYTIPHAAFEVPDLGPYAGESWPQERKAYAAMITRMDRDIGYILDLLDELKLADDTIVFFTSDNGAAGRYDGLFDSAGPFRERKGSVYEGGLRTPMIVRWPGRVPAGKTNDTTAWYFADFLPTAAELAGAEATSGIDGVSVLPTLLGKPQDLTKRFLYWEQIRSKTFQQSARWGDWKAVRIKGGEPLELYDLSQDPGETNNVATSNRAVIERFEKYFKTARTDSEEWPLPRAPRESEPRP